MKHPTRILILFLIFGTTVGVVAASYMTPAVASISDQAPAILDYDSLDSPAPTPDDLKVKDAVNRGLAFLVSIQNEDGSWTNDVGHKVNYSYQRRAYAKHHVGVTAIACMALVAGGHTPERGEYAANVKQGLRFIISNIDRDGMVHANGTRMYSHAFATLFLAEVYGMTRDREAQRALHDAVAFIKKNQVSSGVAAGGWRYKPKQQDADLSIVVCQLQALRAARNVGVLVEQEHIDAARRYISRNYNIKKLDGTFWYQREVNFQRTSFALTAAGIVALQSAGQYESYRTNYGVIIDYRKSLRSLTQGAGDEERPDQPHEFGSRITFRARSKCGFNFWYGHYYAAQAFHQYQHVDPKLWEMWNTMNRTHFLAMQRDNGAWIDEIGGWDQKHNAYATAMACLILSIPNAYLPIFQH